MALHQLHHRPECEDIRSAYDSERSWHSDYESDLSNVHAPSQSSSHKSCRAQPTTYFPSSSRRPPRVHYDTHGDDIRVPSRYFDDREPQDSPHASSASTVQSEEDLAQEDDIPQYDVPRYTSRSYEPSAIPATPSDFSELFPSHRKLIIRHDDSTLDGNMNLRVDTEVLVQGGRRCDMTLFHLRMHDLRDREFSLRRYCRDSGREVCHAMRKPQKSSSARPSLQRSLSNALGTMRVKSDQKSPTMSSLKRNDSGYGSTPSSIDFDRDDRPISASASAKAQQPVDLNSVKLEFSNYAQVEVKRVGGKVSKRYEFEYWGTSYAWRRVVRKDAPSRSVSYHLTKAGHDKDVLAYISPSPLTQAQREEEQGKGGWVPPCSMWLADESLVCGQKDVADVVIASGLIALVDESIRARFHSKQSQQLMIPKLQSVDYVSPKRLINGMFRRESSGTHSRRSSTSRPSSSHRS